MTAPTRNMPPWLEDELRRNDMEPVHQRHQPRSKGPKATDVIAQVGAAKVAFPNPYETFDVEEPVDRRSTDELYVIPEKADKKPSVSEAVLLAQVANVLSSVDVLTADEKPYEEKTDGEKFGRDAVTLPLHYARYAIEPIRFAVENNLNFLQANIVKYILRFDAKNGMEDLNKAERYLTLLKRFANKEPDWWKP